MTPATPGLTPQPGIGHGGVADGCRIDLSFSLNPLGPHPAALAAARSCPIGRYPEPGAAPLAAAAAARHGLSPSEVVPVPGAAAGAWVTLIALLGPGDACVLVAPTFGEHERCLRMVGARLRSVWDWPPRGCLPDELEEALGAGARFCLLVNPSTPSGRALPGGEVRRLCAAHPDTLFLIDEAFVAFAPPGTSILEGAPPPANTVVLRSLTKELGLPGLRMGYLVAPEERAAHLRGLLPAWPLSAPSIAAAVAGLTDLGHVERGAEVARSTLAAVRRGLEEAGADPSPRTPTTWRSAARGCWNGSAGAPSPRATAPPTAWPGTCGWRRRPPPTWTTCWRRSVAEPGSRPARALMLQGTSSSVGKSFLVAGLCRLYTRRGLGVAPFKSQNMALNSAVTADGREIGRAQAMQAEAARVPAEAVMNPILLKAETDSRCQVVVMGRRWAASPPPSTGGCAPACGRRWWRP